MAFIQGYISSLTIGTDPVEGYTSSATLSYTTNPIDVTTLGLTNKTYLPGLKDGSIDFTMHLDTVGAGLIWASNESTVPVAYVFRAGALGAKDSGSFSGEMLITDYSQVGNVDDNWVLNITGQLSGVPVYTQPV
jgi:hypothetical protein